MVSYSIRLVLKQIFQVKESIKGKGLLTTLLVIIAIVRIRRKLLRIIFFCHHRFSYSCMALQLAMKQQRKEMIISPFHGVT